MNTDVALPQHRHAGDALIACEVVQVDMEQRRSRHLGALLQRVADVPKIVQALGAEQVDDEVRACALSPISLDEVVFPVLSLR